MKNILKVWLKKNELTPDPNDYTAVVSSAGSINKSGLIDAIMEEGAELERETIENAVTRYNRQAAKYSTSGWNVDTGLVYLRPTVTGALYGRKFDPEKNSVYISATQGLDIRRELAQTEVEILGEMPDVISILQVTNLQSKTADGTLTRGRNAQVDGTYIKIAGEDPSVGVYLIDATSGFETKLEPDYIVVNDRSKLLLLIPADLPAGSVCRLKVVTQFTAANKLLKAPRQVIFGQELTVI
ncbi:MAG: DUF4469 domain-containing protein [Bacteroidales bacterium]|jgi:hypothetical protein|nr:DUF4469 domain-containing protein [Bacteroidales bacterium]